MHRVQDADTQRPKAAQALHVLVYVSKAAHQVRADELERLLHGARRRNTAAGITGVLLYSDGAFMQYLEGSAEALRKVYAFIKADPLHYGLVVLVREPIAQRQFDAWSMGCHVVGTSEPLARPHEPAERYAELAARVASLMRPRSVASDLIRQFWVDGRSTVAAAAQHYGHPPLPSWIQATPSRDLRPRH
jgi:hypothetical protein